MADKILVHRAMALGDVILTTPIVRALFNDGDCEIDVSSNYPIVFKDNPYIKQALHPSQVNAADYDQIYNLDLVYEKSPKQHIIEAYKDYVFGAETVIDDLSLDLYADDADRTAIDQFILDNIKTDRFIVVHMRKDGWPSRNIPVELWGDILEPILDDYTDVTIVQIGGLHEISFDGDDRLVNALGKFTIHELKELISRAEVFVGVDSAPFHIAATTTTPTVAFFTAVSHEYRKPLAKGAEFEPLIANVDCYGCMADVPAPNTEYSCRRGDVACVNSFDAKLVLDKIEKFL